MNKMEKDKYLQSFFETIFFSKWKGETKRTWNTHNSLELIVSPECNLRCKYCYVNRFKDGLYEKSIRNKEEIIANTQVFLDWFYENNYKVPTIELFSGSLFSQDVGWQVIKVLIDKMREIKEELRPAAITVPSNFTFLIDDEMVKKVESTIAEFAKLKIRFHLSGSVEGKYMEQNRPFAANLKKGLNMGEHIYIPERLDIRDDDYYDKVFRFCRKYDYGFHPMIYCSGIELWKKNFLWFQQQLRRHNMHHKKIFLLEVRNAEWTNEQVKEFYEFVKFVFYWIFVNVCMCSKERFLSLIDNNQVTNLVYSPFGRNRAVGITCSIQSTFFVRLGDLHIVPCHRLSYKGLEYGRFIVKENKITGIEAINPELCTQIYGLHHSLFPMCVSCPINKICNYTCLGSNLENTGDMFTPSPTVCRLEFAKSKAVLDATKEIGVFGQLMASIGEDQRSSYEMLDRISRKESIK